jgi:anti-sigma factor RsiW
MKTFEEKFTAWIDGTLDGDEIARFEAEMAATPEAAVEKLEARKLGDLLRASATPRLSNPDFFNHQLMERIARENLPASVPAQRGWFHLPAFRLAAVGGISALIALAFLYANLRFDAPAGSTQAPYVAEIIDARSADPSVYVSTIQTEGEDGATVLWLDGLDYVPPDHPLVSDARK